MQLPARPCIKPGCPVLNCSEHSNAKAYDQARASSERRQIYRSSRWRQLRLIVLSRDPICRACGDEAATDADHVIAIDKGGDVWSLDNLQGLCAGCHARKTRVEMRGGG